MNYEELEKRLKEANSKLNITYVPLFNVKAICYGDYIVIRLENDKPIIHQGSEVSNVILYTVLEVLAKYMLEVEKEPKRYFLQHKWLGSYDYKEVTGVITKDCDGEDYFLDSLQERYPHQQFFTLEEIEEIKKRFDTDLCDFEMVEVEE